MEGQYRARALAQFPAGRCSTQPMDVSRCSKPAKENADQIQSLPSQMKHNDKANDMLFIYPNEQTSANMSIYF
jgi:hypothetical protein